MSEFMIKYVDAHIGGESLRLVLRGPQLKGTNLLEKREYMMKHYDQIRTAVVLEPRGHDDMYGAVLVDPCHPAADLVTVKVEVKDGKAGDATLQGVPSFLYRSNIPVDLGDK